MNECETLKTVDVLLSTYNGEKYLMEQLHSIYLQQNVKTNLYVRDDKSTDRTPQILSQEASNFFYFEAGRMNLGPKLSFFSLLKAIPTGNYVAFADQDDNWHSNKLHKAILKLENYASPAIYCSNVSLGENKMTSLPSPKFPLSFFQNSAMGCTIVMNSKAHELLKNFDISKMVMHDWGILLIIQAIGNIEFDTDPGMDYRLHSGQTIGLRKNSLFTRIFKLSNLHSCVLQFITLEKQLNHKGIVPHQSDAFADVNNMLRMHSLRRLWFLVSYRNRFRDEISAEVIFRIKIFVYLGLKRKFKFRTAN